MGGLLDGKLIWAEKAWCRYVTDKSRDYRFFHRFMAPYQGTGQSTRPACLHLPLIVVEPSTQSRSMGQVLIN